MSATNPPNAYHPTRRETLVSGLRAGLAACSAAALPRLARGAQQVADGARGLAPRNLVLVQLRGGNDGLDTLIPYGRDEYHAARPKLRIEAGEVRAIDGELGLHPALQGLSALYEQGRMAIVPGVGYPSPNRSHFKSFEIWHTADLRGRAAGEGWVGRLQSAAFDQRSDPNRVVHIGSHTPYSLYSRQHPATSFVSPELYRWGGDELAQRANQIGAGSLEPSMHASGEQGTLADLRRLARSARTSSDAIRAAAEAYRTNVEYPSSEFAVGLRHAAAVLEARIGTRVVSVELSGFDTHKDQVGRRRVLLKQLDEGLSAFVDDLQGRSVGAETLVVVFSEFGRRLAENASRGTDHGSAGPLFVLQPSSRAGGLELRPGLHGARPSLRALDERGDLIHTVDFRSVYAALIQHWFESDSARVLGARFEPLPLFG